MSRATPCRGQPFHVGKVQGKRKGIQAQGFKRDRIERGFDGATFSSRSSPHAYAGTGDRIMAEPRL